MILKYKEGKFCSEIKTTWEIKRANRFAEHKVNELFTCLLLILFDMSWNLRPKCGCLHDSNEGACRGT